MPNLWTADDIDYVDSLSEGSFLTLLEHAGVLHATTED